MIGGNGVGCHHDDFPLAEMDAGRLEPGALDSAEAQIEDCRSCADRSESVRSLLTVMHRDPIRLEPQRLVHIQENVERVLMSSSLESLGTSRSLSDRPLRAAALGIGIGILIAGVVVAAFLVATAQRSQHDEEMAHTAAPDLRELYSQTAAQSPPASNEAKAVAKPSSAKSAVQPQEASRLQMAALLENAPKGRRGRIAGFKKVLNRIEQALEQGKYRRARRIAIRQLGRSPGPAIAALLRTYVAESFVRQNNYEDAAKTYKGIYDRYPDSELGVHALYMAGVVTLKHLERPVKAAALFKRYVSKHLGSDREQDAYKMLCRALIEQNQHREASKVARSYLQRFPNGGYRAAMKWLASQH